MTAQDLFAEFPKYLSYGAIGLGAIALVLFIWVGRGSTPLVTQALYVVLSLAIVGSGVFLEWVKSFPPPLAHLNSCTNETGVFGDVVLRLDVINKDLTSNGPTLVGRRVAKDPLYSLETLGTLADPKRTNSWAEKRFVTSWDCLVAKAQ